MRAAKVQVSLRIRAVSLEPSLLAHTSSESRGTFRQKARSLAPLNGWACSVKICHDGMLEDTNSLDGVHVVNIMTEAVKASNTLLCNVHSDLKTYWVFCCLCVHVHVCVHACMHVWVWAWLVCVFKLVFSINNNHNTHFSSKTIIL